MLFRLFAIVQSGFWTLRRDRGALVLAFAVPTVMFSIFAMVFGAIHSSGIPRVSVLVVDEDGSAVSGRLVRGLGLETSLEIHVRPETKAKEAPAKDYTAATAEAAVRAGVAPVALIIPKGFGASHIAVGPTSTRPDNGQMQVTMLKDSADPIAAEVLNGMLQKSVMTIFPDIAADSGMQYLDMASGGLTAAQKANTQANLDKLRDRLDKNDRSGTSGSRAGATGGLIQVEHRDLVGEHNRKRPLISFYAAGIGVMYLMFTASVVGGTLLDEAASGTLDRVLSSRVDMTVLLIGKLAYCTILASLQLTVMFVWGALVFHLELLQHLPGFLVMTAVTSFTVSCFGLFLACVTRTRAQLSGVSTLIVLTMSALGGSMFPPYMMPKILNDLGLFTINSWAIEGYTKVFWRDQPVWSLWPQVGVLVGLGLVMLLIARRFARRWEYA